ncbi:hypothetical protein DY468_24225 [Rhodopseudomonas sp. BR0M22]|nr:hypothetical protein [Rhodopseudomonas sp. BR0M22]
MTVVLCGESFRDARASERTRNLEILGTTAIQRDRLLGQVTAGFRVRSLRERPGMTGGWE